MQYKIFEGNMERLEKKLQRISNKCKKYGNDFHYEKIGEEFQKDSDEYGNKFFSKYYIIEVSGTALISNDWRFVAVLEHQEHAKNYRNIPEDVWNAEVSMIVPYYDRISVEIEAR